MIRIAAIDIGTNSLHMIVVRVRSDFSFEVIDREKEMVRLGAGGLDGRALTPEAMQAALQVLSKFKRLAASHRVDKIVAVATSAVREAENGGEFLHAIASHTGIRAKVIAGTEEARLIHIAAAYGVSLPGHVAVVVDIGGGSVEITRGVGSNVEMARSFKLGVIRLAERFVSSDPISPRDERKLVRHIRSELGEYLGQVEAAGFDQVIGTSGTILSLGAVASGEAGASNASLRNRRISSKNIRRVRRALEPLNIDRRMRVPGLDPRRADLAVPGAILLDTILQLLGAKDLTLCDLSLREGLVLDYIARHRKEIVQADRYPDVRRRSVVELAERCNYSAQHAQHIAQLALALFDQTRAIHGLTDREREWLEYAALLHDIGVHISYEGHHKHSCYLVRNGDLRGFEPDEIEAMALVARYHRRATPKRGHEGYRDLKRSRQQVVRTLAALLRLAESLDRSHSQSVTEIEFHDRGDDALLQLRTGGDAELEQWAATRHAAPFERLIGKSLHVEVSRNPYVEQLHDAAPPPDKAVRHRDVREVRKAGSAGQVAREAGTGPSARRMALVRTPAVRKDDQPDVAGQDAGKPQAAGRRRAR